VKQEKIKIFLHFFLPAFPSSAFPVFRTPEDEGGTTFQLVSAEENASGKLASPLVLLYAACTAE
jgi:hypothetical protein